MRLVRYLPVIFIIISCASIKPDKPYLRVYTETLGNVKNHYRQLAIIIRDSTLCEVVNTYYCKDIPDTYRRITQYCSYSRVGDTMIIKRIAPDSLIGDYIRIPSQTKSKCSVFHRTEPTDFSYHIGPRYWTTFEKYCLIPVIQTDTLKIVHYRSKEYLFLRKPSPYSSKYNHTFCFKTYK